MGQTNWPLSGWVDCESISQGPPPLHTRNTDTEPKAGFLKSPLPVSQAAHTANTRLMAGKKGRTAGREGGLELLGWAKTAARTATSSMVVTPPATCGRAGTLSSETLFDLSRQTSQLFLGTTRWCRRRSAHFDCSCRSHPIVTSFIHGLDIRQAGWQVGPMCARRAKTAGRHREGQQQQPSLLFCLPLTGPFCTPPPDGLGACETLKDVRPRHKYRPESPAQSLGTYGTYIPWAVGRAAKPVDVFAENMPASRVQ
ncbi:hypothetical protein CCHR01_12611 [Colletotrichum chrysophilum]|uniref:Uncharacterized protein n=1 Tax=Colletotrichum chrysophilum TaxID=1836956 RepID=A0AAD9AB18_9PEZI|nr:hypothetical protein CCHR01_12611 [Colletotrichum chrysophilum]